MGGCLSSGGGGGGASSSADDVHHSAVEVKLEDVRRQAEKRAKLLVLGTGNAGKTTFAKQMKLLYGGGFTDAERAKYASHVQFNAVVAVLHINEWWRQLPITHALAPPSAIVDAMMELAITMRRHQRYSAKQRAVALPTQDNVGSAVRTVVFSSKFEAALAQAPDNLVTPAARKLLESARRVLAVDYVPTDEDIMLARKPTKGVVSFQFPFRMIDVGGQRTERKKWLACFNDVSLVVYIVSLVDFADVLDEDKSTNAMHEAVSVFRSTVQARELAGVPFVLLFNKADLFDTVLARSPLSAAFPAYTGTTAAEARKFIQQQFMSCVTDDRTVYVHETCATDTTMMARIFESVSDAVMQRRLAVDM